MSETIVPQNEMLRRALHWISDERTAHPEKRLRSLLEEAAVRFNLSPAEEEWLLRTLR